MRLRSRPASGISSGSPWIASQEPPGRRGASHSSQARPSTNRPIRLPTARLRVQATTGGNGAMGAVVIAGYDATDEPPDPLQTRLARRTGAPGPDASDLALARHPAHPAPAFSRGPPRP